MNILESILSNQGGAIVKNIAAQFGLNENQVQSAIKTIGPILAGALTQNVKRDGGAGSLLEALKSGNHGQYIDNSNAIADPDTSKDGNDILGHIFGDKAVSREAASKTAPEIGIGADIVKKLLPILASVVMGSLSKQASSNGMFEQVVQADESDGSAIDGLLGILKPMLDQNKDGSAMDDILRMATRYLS